MSPDNVALVLGFLRALTVRDKERWAKAVNATLHPDVACVFRGLPEGDETYTGTDGFRRRVLEWIAPWASYRWDVQEAIDCGDRVLVLGETFGRAAGSTEEVRFVMSDVWTVRDQKIVRWETYPNRDDAFKALGLSR